MCVYDHYIWSLIIKVKCPVVHGQHRQPNGRLGSTRLDHLQFIQQPLSGQLGYVRYTKIVNYYEEKKI